MPRGGLHGVPLAALAFVVLSPAAQPARDPARPDVLLISVDTLRPDALGWVAGRNPTPALDALFPPSLFPPGFKMSICLFVDPSTCADAPTFNVGLQYLFWDSVHPTTGVHEVLGQLLYDVLEDVPQSCHGLCK